jgi:hypothetical protein
MREREGQAREGWEGEGMRTVERARQLRKSMTDAELLL